MAATPLPPLGCACASLRRAARAVTQLYDTALRPYGLRSTQHALLQALASHGSLTQTELGGLLALDPATLTRSLAPLAEEVWVTGRKGDDRRETIWQIAPSGRFWLEAAGPAWNRAQEQLRSRLEQSQWSHLFGDLTVVAEAAIAATAGEVARVEQAKAEAARAMYRHT